MAKRSLTDFFARDSDDEEQVVEDDQRAKKRPRLDKAAQSQRHSEEAKGWRNGSDNGSESSNGSELNKSFNKINLNDKNGNQDSEDEEQDFDIDIDKAENGNVNQNMQNMNNSYSQSHSPSKSSQNRNDLVDSEDEKLDDNELNQYSNDKDIFSKNNSNNNNNNDIDNINSPSRWSGHNNNNNHNNNNIKFISGISRITTTGTKRNNKKTSYTSPMATNGLTPIGNNDPNNNNNNVNYNNRINGLYPQLKGKTMATKKWNVDGNRNRIGVQRTLVDNNNIINYNSNNCHTNNYNKRKVNNSFASKNNSNTNTNNDNNTTADNNNNNNDSTKCCMVSRCNCLLKLIIFLIGLFMGIVIISIACNNCNNNNNNSNNIYEMNDITWENASVNEKGNILYQHWNNFLRNNICVNMNKNNNETDYCTNIKECNQYIDIFKDKVRLDEMLQIQNNKLENQENEINKLTKEKEKLLNNMFECQNKESSHMLTLKTQISQYKKAIDDCKNKVDVNEQLYLMCNKRLTECMQQDDD